MKALIRVIRKTEYASVIEMSDEKFKLLSQNLMGEKPLRKLAEKELNRLIDTNDWQDDDFDSVEEFGAYHD